MNRIRYLIIGAGPAGLTAAWRLQQAGENNFLVLERNRWPGGLSASFRDRQGFTWDLGGHVSHSHYPEYDCLLDDLMPGDRWLEHRRQAWIFFPKVWIPYPFQLNLARLPSAIRRRCEDGLRAARFDTALPPRNFHDWILGQFGEGIAGIFMDPYNRKVWGVPTEMIGTYWLDDRVALPDTSSRARNRKKSWGPNAVFRFPFQGGTGSIWSSLALRLRPDHIRYGCEVKRIDIKKRRVETRSGFECDYDVLLSTMPLIEILNCLRLPGRLPAGLKFALRATPVAVVGIGLEGSLPVPLRRVTWMYFPDPGTKIYRMTVFSRYSPQNVPEPGPYWSMMFEISGRMTKFNSRQLANTTVAEARRFGLLPEEVRVVSRWTGQIPYAYPIPTRDRENVRPDLLEKLARWEIYSRGRFGAWMYEVGNMDHCSMQGLEWADRMLTGAAELTINDPRRVNHGRS